MSSNLNTFNLTYRFKNYNKLIPNVKRQTHTFADCLPTQLSFCDPCLHVHCPVNWSQPYTHPGPHVLLHLPPNIPSTQSKQSPLSGLHPLLLLILHVSEQVGP